MKGKTIQKLGEFGLIEFIKKHNTKPTRQHNVFLDIGDDCFVFNPHKKSKYVEKSENINSCFRITSNFTKEEMLAIKQQKKELMW